MLHEKPDELFHWKNKLDSLDHLPQEHPLNKSTAWQKLQVRLEKKPVHTLKRWYWIAAACMLLFAGLTWFNRPTQYNNNAAVDTQQKKENILVIEPAAVDTPVNIQPEVQEHKNKYFTMPTKNPGKKLISVGTIQPDTSFFSAAEESPASPEETRIVPGQDTSFAPSGVAVKKKLRVVHINELDKPAHLPDFASNMKAPFSKQVPDRQDVFHGFEFSRNASDNLLKIKLPPSN